LKKIKLQLVCKISIIDNGPGIPEKIKDSIFFPMITGKQKGTGLGLSITQGIISQHKGNVHYNTRSNRTEFFINLPITNSQEKLREIANG
jgi:Signal transduction histidine kinase, nitrogen specific